MITVEASAALRQLEGAMKSAHGKGLLALRVAAQHLRAANETLLDQMCRLQLLEGNAKAHGASVTKGSWSSNPRRGLKQAKAWYDMAVGERVIKYEPHPDWFSSSNTGMYDILRATAASVLRKSYVPDVSAEDILQNLLMGLALDGARRSQPLYELGLKGNLRGEAPTTIAKQGAAKAVFRAAMNEATRIKRQKQIMDEHGGAVHDDAELGGVGGFSALNPQDKLRIVADIFVDKRDPIGKKMRELLRRSLQGGRNPERIQAWMDFIEEKGRVPSSKDKLQIAADLGIPVQVLDRYIRQTMEVFIPKFIENPRIQAMLEARFVNRGIYAMTKRVQAAHRRLQAAFKS